MSQPIPDIYTKIWEKAKPYYEKGRPMDVPHIEWMMRVAWELCEKEHFDDAILMPLVILHDVGYKGVEHVANVNSYNKDIRKLHMELGRHYAVDILTAVSYPQDKILKVAYYVSIHDMWAFEELDLYVKDPILGIFKDLDYLWIYTPIGFKSVATMLNKNDQQMLAYIESETSPIYGKKPFSSESTKTLREQYLEERRKAVTHA
jgi:hypothetical protein